MKQVQATFLPWRFYILLGFILLITASLMSWMVYLALIKQHFLRTQGDARVLRVVNTPAFRGVISDRHGNPLAVSTTVDSIWVNPQEFAVTTPSLKILSSLVGIQGHILLSKTIANAKNKNREFLYLKRGLAPHIATKIKSLQIPGVYVQREYKRYYPEGEVTAHVIGFTNVDDKGQEGLELAYDKWLVGMPGKKLVVKDRLGRVMNDVKTFQEQKSGNNLVLSIDRRLQYLAYRELLAGVQNNVASSGSVIVLDTKTGEVLSMVNQPSFNPNNRVSDNNGNYRNRAITDIFEPGSTIKAFSVASALDSGQYKPDSIINTNPGWIHVGTNVVRDEHFKGPMTVTQVLQKSSNVGVVKMILSLPPNQLWSLLHRVGFGEETNSGFPGERAGVLVKYSSAHPFSIATLAFGYGISVTTLQLAHAYAVLANHGLKLPVSLLRLEENIPQGEQVIEPRVADEMLLLLEAVLEKGGTGTLARVPGYRIAGKTGTTIIAGPHGYAKNERHYISSFVGIAPVSNPRFVVAVVIHDPKGQYYYGAQVAAPIFAKIMEGALRLYDVPPDNLAGLNNSNSEAPVDSVDHA